jgi:hypothetical protein
VTRYLIHKFIIQGNADGEQRILSTVAFSHTTCQQPCEKTGH